MNMSVDVLGVMHSVLGDLMAAQVAGVDADTNVPELSACIDVISKLIEAANGMSSVLHEYGQYDDGCFYYCGLSSPEFERPLSLIDSALARVGGAA